MTPDQMGDLHARGMTTPPPWSARDFKDLLASPLVFTVGDTSAFAMGRVIADEAELLTIVTDPDQRRSGLGRACLATFESEAARRGATTAFLEVAETNAPARALYASEGWRETGRRKGYYATSDGTRVDAILMAKPLNQAASG